MEPNDRSEPLTWMSAERLAVEHLRWLGYSDATQTPPGADGGVDAVGNGVLAQVKFHAVPVGAPDVQRLRGAAHRGERAIFYSRSGYTAQARQFASTAAVALFQFAPDGVVVPANPAAAQLQDDADDREAGALDRLIQSLQYCSHLMQMIETSSTNAERQLHAIDPDQLTDDAKRAGQEQIVRLERQAGPEIATLNAAVDAHTAALFQALIEIESAMVEGGEVDKPARALLTESTQLLASVTHFREQQIDALAKLASAIGLDAEAMQLDDE